MNPKQFLALALIAVFTFSSVKTSDTDWFEVLGLTFFDKTVVKAFDKYGEKSNFHKRSSNTLQMNWEEDGLSAVIDEPGRILSLYFYNNQYKVAESTFKRFEGKLPLDVNLDLEPDEVIKKIGKPTKDEGSSYRRLFYKTNYEYEFLFRQDVMQYMRIGLLGGKAKGKGATIGE